MFEGKDKNYSSAGAANLNLNQHCKRFSIHGQKHWTLIIDIIITIMMMMMMIIIKTLSSS